MYVCSLKYAFYFYSHKVPAISIEKWLDIGWHHELYPFAVGPKYGRCLDPVL